MVEKVGGTIEWARNKLDAFPKAKRDLGPLLDALGRTSPSLLLLLKCTGMLTALVFAVDRTANPNRVGRRAPPRGRAQPARQPPERARARWTVEGYHLCHRACLLLLSLPSSRRSRFVGVDGGADVRV